MTLLYTCKDQDGGLIPSGKGTSDFPEEMTFPPVQRVTRKENNCGTLQVTANKVVPKPWQEKAKPVGTREGREGQTKEKALPGPVD